MKPRSNDFDDQCYSLGKHKLDSGAMKFKAKTASLTGEKLKFILHVLCVGVY